MTRRPIISLLPALLLAACVGWTSSALMAEPIKQGEAGAAAGTPAQMPEVTEAITKFNERDYDGALKLLQEAVKKNAELPPANVLMAQFFSQLNVAGGVRNALERAVVEAPDDPEAYMLMGDIALRERRVTEARLLYAKANSLMADWKGNAKRREVLQPRILGGMAASAEAQQDWGGAEKQLLAWLKLDPKNAGAMQQLAQCMFQQKNVEGALKELKEAAKADPDVLTPEAILAQFYARGGDQENARKWMVAALTAAPKDLKTRLVAAQWSWETGQLDEAKKQAAAAMGIDSKSLDAKLLRGVVALFQKDYKAAELYFESAVMQSPRNFAASNNLALALIEQKDEAKRDRALQWAEANVRQNPKSAEAASTYGWVLYKLGRIDDAEKALSSVVSSGGFNADTAYYWARILVDRGRAADAKRLLEGALKTPGPFAQREDAKSLLDSLKK